MMLMMLMMIRNQCKRKKPKLTNIIRFKKDNVKTMVFLILYIHL